MNIPRLGVGPMSIDIARIVCSYSIEMDQPLMIIASRNQVDHQGGYVCTTDDLSRIVRESGATDIMLCRDHCGPYFKDSDANLDIVSAMECSIKTIDEDIDRGFNLIHIDVGRILTDREKHASTLINHAISRKPDIILEYGSEDNIGKSCAVESFANDLEFLRQFKKNVRFVVAQTGSLVKDQQVGEFDIDSVKRLSALAHEHGYLFKEHNSDYLSSIEISRRFAAGVDAMNIAPQLGTAQTEIVRAHAMENGLEKLWESFVEVVVSGKKWSKWISQESYDPDQLAVIAGHYHQQSPIMQTIVSTNHKSYIKNLSNKVYDILDTYLERQR